MPDEQDLMARAFDEWMRRFLHDPTAFNREFEEVASYREGAYGTNQAAYLRKLMAELEPPSQV